MGHLRAVAVAALVIAAISASLDAAIDAHRTDAAHGGNEGAAASGFVLGYRVAFVSIGALVLIFVPKIALLLGPEGDLHARELAWRISISVAGLAMLVGLGSAFLAPEPPNRRRPESLSKAVVEPFRALAHSFGPRLGVVLFVALFFRLPDLLGNKMTMPFLQQELGFRLEDIGYIILAQTGKSLDVFKAVVVVESFCNGLVSAAFVAYFMMLCLPRFAAAQYALLSGLMFLASAIVGASSGWLVERLGYQSFFMISIVVGIPPLLALPWAMPRAGDDDAALSND